MGEERSTTRSSIVIFQSKDLAMDEGNKSDELWISEEDDDDEEDLI